ncbi:hypothetical protein N9571_01735 [Yoonia sp.]|nr:hypothetical protein [Yoonia sp.]
MKSILLTTTAIVAFAGAAAADGHISIGWSGTATAGVAREGGSDATAGDADAFVAGLLESYEGTQTPMTETSVLNGLLLVVNNFSGEAPVTSASDADDIEAAIVGARSEIEALVDLLVAANSITLFSDANLAAAAAQAGAHLAAIDALIGTDAVATKEFDTYAEINATVSGSVATDNGLTLTAAMSVDAGMGYDFADDDGFDSKKTNGVGFDHVSLDAGTFGTLKFAPDDIAHLVDDDDDAAVDVLYTNDFGIAKFSFALDIDTDSDVEARAGGFAIVDIAVDDVTTAAVDERDVAIAAVEADGGTVLSLPNPDVDVGGGSYSETVYSTFAGPAFTANTVRYAPVAADVQWSAKVEAPVGDIATVYAAFDEEGGYDIGATTTVAGLTVKAKVKSEALAVAQDKDAEFDVSGSYTVSGLTVGAGWNSIEDGDQWRISGAYTMGAISVAASTDEGEDWEVTGSYDLGSGASLVGGVNYTEDAYVGVSFKF